MAQAGTLMTDDAATEARRAARRHREVLGVSCFVVVMAFLLQVLPDQRVAFRGLARYPMPPTCSTRTWLGLNCPGCGLTRALVHLARADWRASLRTHRLGGVMAGVILFQIPYRALALRRPDRPWIGPRAATALAYLLIALLLGNWLYDVLATP
jgi:hypothetical protein